MRDDRRRDQRSVADIAERISELDSTRPTVVYCASGVRSSIAASLLRTKGFTDVADISAASTPGAPRRRRPPERCAPSSRRRSGSSSACRSAPSAGGGSILADTALVYAAGQDPKAATTSSLFLVGAAALVGMVTHHRAGRVRVGIGVVFGLTGIGGSLLGSAINRQLDPNVLLLGFSGLVLVAAWRMLVGCPYLHQGRRRARASIHRASRRWCICRDSDASRRRTSRAGPRCRICGRVFAGCSVSVAAS